MANDEHVDILNSGVDKWNTWRLTNSNVVPDLSESKFSGRDLSSVNLEGVNLDYSDFSRACLNGAILNKAYLEGTDFTGADLRRAQLHGCHAQGVIFRDANLTDAEIVQAELVGANLKGANFTNADLQKSDLSCADLEGVDLRPANLNFVEIDEQTLENIDIFEGDPKHLAILLEGPSAWYKWRKANPDTQPDLRGANLTKFDMSDGFLLNFNNVNFRRAIFNGCHFDDLFNFDGADLTGAHLNNCHLEAVGFDGANLAHASLSNAFLHDARFIKANLFEANLHCVEADCADFEDANLMGSRSRFSEYSQANFSGANLENSDFEEANLSEARIIGAKLCRANFEHVRFWQADFTSTDLSGANLRRANLSESNLEGVSLSDCKVYGVSAWDVNNDEVKDQANLVITPGDEAAVTVDNLEVAHFVYMMLNNRKIRDVIDTISCKGVLILGRFTSERKAILDGIKKQLRSLNMVPMVFDWDKPTSRDLTETVQLLANMSRFVVADVTDAKSIPQELMSIVPSLPSVPVQPLVQSGQREYAMFEHFASYPWVLPVFEYSNQEFLMDNIEEAIVAPVLDWESGSGEKLKMEQKLIEQEAEISKLKQQLESNTVSGNQQTIE